ncbi:hypothetical protein NQ318_005313 [Aromia moschata]|uniref:Uncharacterized protein n=1 Tax=Aromia moschata TaxID=1265417 RepID=A0AAV8XTJ8_9CUCU|nr:hypothetical protein NQ318_005313 [Aromia moschata]
MKMTDEQLDIMKARIVAREKEMAWFYRSASESEDENDKDSVPPEEENKNSEAAKEPDPKTSPFNENGSKLSDDKSVDSLIKDNLITNDSPKADDKTEDGSVRSNSDNAQSSKINILSVHVLNGPADDNKENNELQGTSKESAVLQN